MADNSNAQRETDWWSLGNAIAGALGSAFRADPNQLQPFTGDVSAQAMMERFPAMFEIGLAQALSNMMSPVVAPGVTGAAQLGHDLYNIPGLDFEMGFNPAMAQAFAQDRTMYQPQIDPRLLELLSPGASRGNNPPGPLAGEGPMTPEERAQYGPGGAVWRETPTSERGRYGPTSLGAGRSGVAGSGQIPGLGGPFPPGDIMGQIGMGMMPFGTGNILQEILRRRREDRQEGR